MVSREPPVWQVSVGKNGDLGKICAVAATWESQCAAVATEIAGFSNEGTSNNGTNVPGEAIVTHIQSIPVRNAFILLGDSELVPESIERILGASIAKGISSFFFRGIEMRVSLIVSESAAGFSSGLNAAVAGWFFAIESVLHPSPVETSSSLTDTTSIVMLSAVMAVVVSQVGLGSEPAFKVT